MLERTITHWTAGAGRASSSDLKHYHYITQQDLQVVKGTEDPQDNIVTSDGDYAAHTRNLNTGSAGMAMAGMLGATEVPFNPGKHPITREQFERHCQLLAWFHEAEGIPVTRETCLTHAEVQPTLGVKQRGKWDLTRLPFEPGIVGAIPVGDYMRERVKTYMRNPPDDFPRPTLVFNDKGPYVVDLQAQLTSLGYPVGKVDGHYGARTRAAVQAFRVDHGLPASDVVDGSVWKLLITVDRRADRDVTEDDLRIDGSRTIAVADKAETQCKQAGAGLFGLAGLDTVFTTLDKLEGSQDILTGLTETVVANWPALLILGLAVAIYLKGPELMGKIKGIRVDDAVSGANIKR